MITFKNPLEFYNQHCTRSLSGSIQSPPFTFRAPATPSLVARLWRCVLLKLEPRRAHEGVSAAEFWLGFPAGTSYLKTTLNSFPPSRSASHEFLMTAILRLSQLSMA